MKKSTTSRPNINFIIIFSVLGIVLGFLLFVGFRLAGLASQTDTHYHANWQVWVSGKQVTFDSPLYYQEIASCSTHDTNDLAHRAHLHDGKYETVHVHADGVSWQQFFENINVFASTDTLQFESTKLQNDGSAKLTYILNGQVVPNLYGRVISSEDTLLINFGGESQDELKQRYTAIPNGAKIANETKDPAACSGDKNSSFLDKLKLIFVQSH